MIELIIVVIFGFLGGVAVGTQATIVGKMSERVGGAASSFIVHIGGALASLVLLIARRGEQISEWRNLSWYMLGSGVLGLFLYLSLSQTIPKLGATAAITLIIVGQLIAGVTIDHFGAFDTQVRSLDLSRILACGLVLSGAYILVR